MSASWSGGVPLGPGGCLPLGLGVCLWVQGGVWVWGCAHPLATPLDTHPSWTPPLDNSLMDPDTPLDTPRHTPLYGQQVDGMHPTGMLSSFNSFVLLTFDKTHFGGE